MHVFHWSGYCNSTDCDHVQQLWSGILNNQSRGCQERYWDPTSCWLSFSSDLVLSMNISYSQQWGVGRGDPGAPNGNMMSDLDSSMYILPPACHTNTPPSRVYRHKQGQLSQLPHLVTGWFRQLLTSLYQHEHTHDLQFDKFSPVIMCKIFRVVQYLHYTTNGTLTISNFTWVTVFSQEYWTFISYTPQVCMSVYVTQVCCTFAWLLCKHDWRVFG